MFTARRLPTAGVAQAPRTWVVAPRSAVALPRARALRVDTKARDPEAQAQSALDGGLINPRFAAVLSQALERSGGEKAMLDAASASIEEERDVPLKPVEEMLITAIHTSRATLRRLVERQSELEAEIAKEQKQAARLEWLLNRARSDYAYFGAVDKMNRQSK